jgi:hypothetical protein
MEYHYMFRIHVDDDDARYLDKYLEAEKKTLLENKKMLEKTKKEAEERGKSQSVKQIERAQ